MSDGVPEAPDAAPTGTSAAEAQPEAGAAPRRRRVGGRRNVVPGTLTGSGAPAAAVPVAAGRSRRNSSRGARSSVLAESEVIRRFAQQYPFPLDPFQLEAIRALDSGRSVLAAAPTGTGKTVIAEFGIQLAREQGLRCLYTSPIKALSNQKFRDWRARYGDVGLLTGDVTEHPQGSILVMTTEVLRNMLLQSPHALDDVACVVFDEVHFLADPERGTTWEEAILYCPKHVQLICLSATVANAGELASWISHVHRETVLVTHFERAVPLEHYYYFEGELHLLVDADGKVLPPLHAGGEARHPKPAGIPPRARPREVPRPREVVRALDEAGMLPAIYFLFGRRACELAAQDCSALELIGDRAARQARRERVRAYLDLLDPADRQLEQVQQLAALLDRGIAFHHAGLLPLLKVLVEELFAAGLIGVVFATETLALGINMPARTVVIAEPAKYDGQTRRPLTPNEYSQLVGRAGRRGLDPKGYAVNLYSPWMSCAEVLEVITGELLPIRSAFTPRYNTVAAQWDGSDAARERLVRLFSSSLRQFQVNDALKAAASEVEVLRARAEAAHFVCPYEGVPDGAVIDYIGLRRELEHARKRAQRIADGAEVLLRQLRRPPWPAPAPDEVRREMQRFVGGEVVYVSGAHRAQKDESSEAASLHHGDRARHAGGQHGAIEPGEASGRPDGGAGGEEPAGQPDDRSGQAPAMREGLQPGAWGIFLRHLRRGPGLVLVGSRVEAIERWGDVTYLPGGKPAIDLPEPLRRLEAPVDDVRPLLGSREWRRLQAQLRALDLPDLPGIEARRLEAARAQLEAQVQGVRDQQSRAAEEVRQLEAKLAGHPCHACPIRHDHERALRREMAALRALSEAEAHAAELEEAAASQAERTLDALLGVLQRFGYLVAAPDGDGRARAQARTGSAPGLAGTLPASIELPAERRRAGRGPAAGAPLPLPAEQAAVLARVYDPNGLLLLNLAWSGEFDHLAPAELMELLSWFCYDREGPRWNRHQLTPRLWELRPRIGQALALVQREERERELAITTGPSPGFYGPILAWCRGATFAELLETIAVGEGDLLMTMNKTLDLATQLREALRAGAPNRVEARTLAAKLEVGDRLLRRGIVAQSLRLATALPAPSGSAPPASSPAPVAGSALALPPAAQPIS